MKRLLGIHPDPDVHIDVETNCRGGFVFDAKLTSNGQIVSIDELPEGHSYHAGAGLFDMISKALLAYGYRREEASLRLGDEVHIEIRVEGFSSRAVHIHDVNPDDSPLPKAGEVFATCDGARVLLGRVSNRQEFVVVEAAAKVMGWEFEARYVF